MDTVDKILFSFGPAMLVILIGVAFHDRIAETPAFEARVLEAIEANPALVREALQSDATP